jgi:predicted nucleic acid-binding protein
VSLVVLDAAAVVEFLLGTPLGHELREPIQAPENDLHLPALCDIEVASALRRALLDRKLTERRASQVLTDYLDLPVTRHGHTGLVARLLRLRDNFTAYDAAYLALAERLSAVLVTGDRALARAVVRHTAVEVGGPFR